MATLAKRIVASGHGTTMDADALTHLAMGTLVSLDLKAARHRYEAFFGLECVEDGPDRLYVRDRRAKHLMENGERDFFILQVDRVDAIERPQALLNHWGFSVGCEAEVDRIREIAVARAEEFGFKRVHPTTPMHGSYGFFLIDADDNWWEIEFRRGDTNDLMFSRGYFADEAGDQLPIVNPDLPIASTPCEVLGAEAFMSHGTTGVADCDLTRPFYEEVLGLRTVRHRRPANMMAGGGDFGVVGVGAGDKIQDQLPINRFVLLLDSDADLEQRHNKVQQVAAAHGLRSVSSIGEVAQGRSFLLQTSDGIWFELSTSPRSYFCNLFAGL